MGRFSIPDLLFWVIVVAMIATMTRPGSKAGQAVVDVVDAFAAVVGGATGAAWREGSNR